LRASPAVRFLILLLVLLSLSVAQSPNGTISGIVQDPSQRPIPGAEIIVVNDLTNLQYQTKTRDDGIYVVTDLPPGPYRIQVSKQGFKTLIKPGLIVNVQDMLSVSITLPLGAVAEVVTVEGGAPLINTTDATVSTVIDRQFAENLPLNGRSFQTLIYLTPGVVATPTTTTDNGQFSVNGQRSASNYWMVDGVSANIGIGASYSPGNGFGGNLGSFSSFGGTNSLVSVDAMQEFRIQTSTFAAEFGRTPGGQISIVTRAGTNDYHGTLFDYLRNDAFDANNWFNGYTNDPPLPKPEERQNDFGGTLGGPIWKNKTFFFFSYEGLRLRLPQTALTTVPDITSRQHATAAMKPFLNAYPLPNGSDDISTGIADLNATYSNPATLDAYSLRVDHKLGTKWSFFGRYNYSPSELNSRGGVGGQNSLSDVARTQITTQTATAGTTWMYSPRLVNDFRFNFSKVSSSSYTSIDNFGGAIPLSALPFPSPYTAQNGSLTIYLESLTDGDELAIGPLVRNEQKQINLVDDISWQAGGHSLKFGIDFRRLSPLNAPASYQQIAFFSDLPSAETGNGSGSVHSINQVNLLFRNLAVFAQDTWRVAPKLTVTYGLRWEVDFAPSALNGPSIPAVTGYSLSDFSELSVAPAGTPPFQTTYTNFAPRLGVAYQTSRSPGWESVVRGGFGVFYDLVSAETGNTIGGAPPYANFKIISNETFPWPVTLTTPPSIPTLASLSNLATFNPNLKLPYTLQWNVAFEQSLAENQSLSISYIGASGRRLLQTTSALNPASNPTVSGYFIDNTSSSNYNALQAKFERRLARGLQVLASYTWAHSIDDASGSSYGVGSNLGLPGSNNINRGNSDFDIRNALTAGITYNLPNWHADRVLDAVFHNWSTQSLVLARSAPPVDVDDVNFYLFNSGIYTNIRPDLVPGVPVYLYASEYPGGMAFNPLAFKNPPTDPVTGNPVRQGTLPRNFLRGFGATQWDFAVHREFPLHESLKLQFRAEMFNILNHPNFGPPNNQFGLGGFGIATQILAQSLSNRSLGAGGFDPLYQIGGPRSVQFALKLTF
jgi:Carboxypeptidase regulatory-like domain/TonB dependent receptor